MDDIALAKLIKKHLYRCMSMYVINEIAADIIAADISHLSAVDQIRAQLFFASIANKGLAPELSLWLRDTLKNAPLH